MRHLRLPRLVGTREAVTDLLAEFDIPESLRGDVLVALCRDLVSGSSSFADQLVLETVVQRGADELALVGAPPQFVAHVLAAAERRGVRDRVQVRTAAEAGV